MHSNMNTTVLFREEQRPTQWWIRLIVLGVAAVAWYGFVRQVVLGVPWGDNPTPDALLVLLWLGFGIAFPAGLALARLVTEVQEDALYVRYAPFHLAPRRFPLSDIRGVEVRTYRPLAEYGGWGIRYGLRGKAYSVRGDRGVELELAGGRRLLIGSQQPEALARALEQAARR